MEVKHSINMMLTNISAFKILTSQSVVKSYTTPV